MCTNDTWNVCVRLVKGLYEPYQSLSSASMSNRAVNFFGKYRWKTRLASPKTGKSSIFWLRCSSTTIRSMTTTEAVTTIQTRKNSINHWLLHSPLIVVKKPELVSGDSQVTPHLYLPLYAIFTSPEVNWLSTCSWHAAAVIYFRREVDTWLTCVACKFLYKELSMCNVRKKRAQDKQNYLQNKESKGRAASRVYRYAFLADYNMHRHA